MTKKIEVFYQFQIGFMLTVTSWYKGERTVVVSFPFIDICFNQIQKKYKKPKQ